MEDVNSYITYNFIMNGITINNLGMTRFKVPLDDSVIYCEK